MYCLYVPFVFKWFVKAMPSHTSGCKLYKVLFLVFNSVLQYFLLETTTLTSLVAMPETLISGHLNIGRLILDSLQSLYITPTPDQGYSLRDTSNAVKD